MEAKNLNEYIDIIDEHLTDGDVDQMYTLDYYQDVIDEVYDEEADDWYLAKKISALLYDAKNDVIVSFYEDTYLQDKRVVSCKKAPEWFKSGWEGLVDKTLTKEEFMSYYCDLCNNNYIKRSGVKELINDFLKFAPEFGGKPLNFSL